VRALHSNSQELSSFPRVPRLGLYSSPGSNCIRTNTWKMINSQSQSPQWHLHLDEGLVNPGEGLECLKDPKCYTGGSVATGRVTHAGQDEGERLTTSSSKINTVKKPKDQPRTGRIDVRQTGKAKRTMIKDIIMATWNVRTMMHWLEDVITDLRRMGISGWMEKARNMDQWRRIVEEAKGPPRAVVPRRRRSQSQCQMVEMHRTKSDCLAEYH